MDLVITSPAYTVVNPREKDIEWADRVITQLRMYMRPLVTGAMYTGNKNLLYGQQGTESVEAMFSDPSKANVDFTPEKPLIKIRNILVAELENQDIQIEVKAVDPASINQRRADKEMLSHRAETEMFLSHLGASIGMPAYSLKDEKTLSGQDVFSGNVDKFDNMGMNEGDDEDIDHFFDNWYKLRHEAALDTAIASLLKYNEVIRMIPRWLNDIVSVNTIAGQAYMNTISGAVNIQYLRPNDVYSIPGERPDYKDAICMAYQKNVTMQQLIRMLGDDFDMSRDMQYLIYAVNACNDCSYTGVLDNNGSLMCGTAANTCAFNTFMNYKVGIGYIEFKSIDSTAIKYTDSNFHGNPSFKNVPVNGKSNSSNYKRKMNYDEVTYCSYYLITGPSTQKLYRYGKLPYQHVEGSEDEISSYSICAFKQEGPSIVDICKPHIRIYEKAKKKYEYLINKAKESGYAINIDAMVALAEKLTVSGNKVDPLTLIKEQLSSPNILFATQDIPTTGGTGLPFVELKNGITDAVMEFRNIFQAALADIDNQIGMTPLRQADAPQPRDVARLQDTALQSSRNATQFIDRAIHYVISDICLRAMSYVQDIVKFKEINKSYYKFLLDMLGDETIEDIASMDDVALHRYGIFVEPFISIFDKRDMDAMAKQAYIEKEIGFDEYILIKSINSPKKAAKILSFYKNRKEKKLIEFEQQKAQIETEAAKAKHQLDMELESLKIKGNLQAKDIEGQWYYKAHVEAAQYRADAQKQTIDSTEQIASQKNKNAIEVVEAKNQANTGV